MYKRGFKIFFLCALLGSGDYAWTEVPVPVNPHNYDKKEYCPTCHTIADMPKLNHDIITICVKCHSGNISNHPVSRHPISVKASYKVNIPDWMPLKEGKLVCYTCHDHHNRGSLTRMLRVDYQMLCVACHVSK